MQLRRLRCASTREVCTEYGRCVGDAATPLCRFTPLVDVTVYREAKLLKRSMTKEEARTPVYIARRIAALQLMAPELDANYQRPKRNASATIGSAAGGSLIATEAQLQS